jgi:hypothetical protein
VSTLSERELDALVEEAIIDAYDEYEQMTAFATVIGENVGILDLQPPPPPAGWLIGA